MSISFAAPPKIIRETTPPLRTSASHLPSVLSGSIHSASSIRHDKHGSHSSSRSARSTETTQRRPRSPEPVKYQKKRVSFSTIENDDASMVSFTLKTKHEAYRYTRRSRSFIIGYNDEDYSRSAMEWLVDTMVDDGDEIVVLRVIEPSKCYFAETDVLLILAEAMLSAEDTAETFRAQAKQLQDDIIRMNEDDKELSLVVELAVGNIKLLLLRLMHLYHPDSLIVGTKGRSLNGLGGLKPNSISKWCLQNSPIPVIVVRPDRKRDKAKQKRLQDPNRRSYVEILENSSSFDDLTHSLARQKLVESSSDTTSKTLEVPRITHTAGSSAGSIREGRQSNASDQVSGRGRSPLGRLGQKMTRVFGDSG